MGSGPGSIFTNAAASSLSLVRSFFGASERKDIKARKREGKNSPSFLKAAVAFSPQDGKTVSKNIPLKSCF